MCAIDALGIAPMFDQVIEVASQDPVTGEAFRARILPDGTASWEPGSAVIVAGVLGRQADSCSGCCPVLNFFSTPANAERWLAGHNEVRGRIVFDRGRGRVRTRRLRGRLRGAMTPTQIDRAPVQRLVNEGAQLIEVLPARNTRTSIYLERSTSRSRHSMRRRPASSTASAQSSSTATTTNET